MGKATFPAQSQTVAESTKPADGDGFTPGDHRDAYSAVYQGDISPLRPRANSPANLKVDVARAEIEGFFRNIYWNDNHVTFAGGDSADFTAPTSNPRIDLLVLDVSGGPAGTLTRVVGTEAASPAEPALPDLKTNIPICYVYNRVGQTKIVNFEDSGANPTEGYIYRDVRPWAGSGGGGSEFLTGDWIVSSVTTAHPGWTNVSATYSNKFMRINATPLTTGGADTHSHGAGSYVGPSHNHSGPSHTHSISASENQKEAGGGGGSEYAAASHTHTGSTGSGGTGNTGSAGNSAITGTSATANNIPAYVQVVIFQKD